MNKEDIVRRIGLIKEEQKTANKVCKLALKMVKSELFNCNARIYNEYIALEPTFEQLTETRAGLRKFFGTWEDKLTGLDNPYGTLVLARYENKGNTLIHIWVKLDIDNIPEEYTNNGKCGFKESTEKKLVFACKAEEEV